MILGPPADPQPGRRAEISFRRRQEMRIEQQMPRSGAALIVPGDSRSSRRIACQHVVRRVVGLSPGSNQVCRSSSSVNRWMPDATDRALEPQPSAWAKSLTKSASSSLGVSLPMLGRAKPGFDEAAHGRRDANAACRQRR